MDPRIDELLDFIGHGLSRDEAVQLLKISNNDLSTAASKYYDTEPHNLKRLLNDSVARWDETAFGAGRYGEDEPGNAIPTFNIDLALGYENYPHSGVQSKAPSRPPSRSSILSTHYGDAPMQNTGIENLQESGVVGSSNAVFGPATKDNYDTAQWAMVPTSTAIIPDPVATERQRREGQPGILKPSPRFNYLPALIAILHSIPLVRNTFLAPEITQRSYWMGDEWWKGNPTMPSRIVDISTGVEEAYMLDVIHETQRLIAFLDESDRAYATVGSLLELDAWKETHPALEDEDDDLLKFLNLWCSAYESHVPEAKLNGSIKSVVRVGEDVVVENLVLDTPVFRESLRPEMDLYDVLDDALFASASGSAHIREISKVLTLRLNSSRTDAKDLGCRIPAVLYADRYLEANKPVIDSMYQEMKQYEAQIRDIDTAVQRLKYHTPNKENAKPMDTLKMIEASMKAFQPRDGEESVDSSDAIVLSQLQALHHSIETKIAALDEQIKQLRATLSGISSRFKPTISPSSTTPDLIDLSSPDTTTQFPPGQTPEDAMHHPYHLRGVATNLGVVYLLHPDTTSNTPNAQQWWRMQYDTESANPSIRADRLNADEVVERATSESASALLIYAHADALSPTPLPLPKPLNDFVKKDGLNFMEELQTEHNSWEHMDYDNNDIQRGMWEDDGNRNLSEPPQYEYDWANMSAQEFHSRGDGGMSSTTLTPNTEVDNTDDEEAGQSGGVRDMVAINGGIDPLRGWTPSPPSPCRTVTPVPEHQSSQTVDDEMLIDLDDDQVGGYASKDVDGKKHGEASLVSDAEMRDVEAEPRAQHIEVAEKKGG